MRLIGPTSVVVYMVVLLIKNNSMEVLLFDILSPKRGRVQLWIIPKKNEDPGLLCLIYCYYYRTYAIKGISHIFLRENSPAKIHIVELNLPKYSPRR